MGNLRSVEKALERAGASPAVTREHDLIRAADGVVLPGVGAFPKAMENLRQLELDSLVLGARRRRNPDQQPHEQRELLHLVSCPAMFCAVIKAGQRKVNQVYRVRTCETKGLGAHDRRGTLRASK
jgi:hypothetical protein